MKHNNFLEDFTDALSAMLSRNEKGVYKNTLEEDPCHQQHRLEQNTNNTLVMEIGEGSEINPILFSNFKLKLSENHDLKIANVISKVIIGFTLIVESEGGDIFYPKNVYFEQGKKPEFTKNHTTILIFKTYNKGKTWFVESSGPFFN